MTGATPPGIPFRVLGCSGGTGPGAQPTTYLLGETIAIDAGCLASALSLEAQPGIGDLLLTHAHLDHLRELVLFLDNVYGRRAAPVRIWGIAPVLDALRQHLLNGVLWPDLLSLEPPPAELRQVEPGKPFALGGWSITPFLCAHGVPAAGYLVHPAGPSGTPAVAVMTDSGYDAALFREIASLPALRALLIETSFPDRLEELALLSFHLTPSLLGRALEPIRAAHPGLQVLVTHLKPLHRLEVEEELAALGLPLRVLRDGDRLSL